jgi:hypothetical protein
MNNTTYTRPPQNPSDLPTAVPESTRKNSLAQRWYNMTSIPTPPEDASFVKRDAARKSHLLSTITFWLLVVFILFIPGCFALPNHYVIVADVGMIVVGIVALIFNRAQKPQIAAILLTAVFELALTMVIVTSTPLDEISLQQYELFVFGELLCVSLLTPWNVFIVMAYNITVITLSLIFQPHTAILANDLKIQFAPILLRPVGVQFLVAFVSFLWVQGAIAAIKRANQAETIARLEHELTDRQKDLELGIQQILNTHVEIANGNLNARAPLSQDNALWQIARALNTLLVRLQRASIAEQRLNNIEQAVAATVHNIQQAAQLQQEPRLLMTKTELDPLIAELQGKKIAAMPPAFTQQRPPQKPHFQ